MAARTLLIVDDHPLFADGFAHMARDLRPEWSLRVACSAAQAVAALKAEPADLAIVDVGLPGADGFALKAMLAADWPAMPVVLISGREDAGVWTRARASRAAGFIVKTTVPDTMLAMLDAVLLGGVAFLDEPRAAGVPVLTQRQAEVLELLAEGHANKEIRHRLGIAERTVRAHLTELFAVLGANSRMQAVIRGRELGLIAR